MDPKMPTPEKLAGQEKKFDEVGDLELADKLEREKLKENPVSTETGKSLEEIRGRIEKIRDIDNIEIEQDIRETVSTFNFAGFPTSQSCEGHKNTEDGALAPWVLVAAPNEPEKQYIGQDKIFKEVAKKYRVSAEDVMKGIGENEEAYKEAWQLVKKNKISPEYKKWDEKNRKFMQKCQKLLDEFYEQGHSDGINETVHIKIKELDGGFPGL